MEWSEVAEDWPAFIDAIMENWPELDQELVEDMEGDRAAFRRHIMEVYEEEAAAVNEQIREWLESGIPLDAMMDESRDNRQIVESGRFIHPGEDVYSDDREFGDDDQAERPMGRTA